jgi:MFS family permease
VTAGPGSGVRRRRLPRRDTVASAISCTVFSVSLGLASVALPLLALEAGYTGVQVGVLVAVSALSQMLSRIGMGAWMNRFPDWTFILAAVVLLAVSNATAALTTAIVPFVAAHLLQGIARAFFWTGSQTHSVRSDRPAVTGLAVVNLASAAGLLAGPLVAGYVGAYSFTAALAVGAALAAVACVPTLLLDRLPPFSPPADRAPGRIWRRRGVDAGCWAAVSAGAWRGLLGSYVPVALEFGGQSTPVIGGLVSLANGAQLAGSAAAGRLRGRGLVLSLVVGALAAGLATAAVGLLAGQAVLAGVVLAVSGLGAGVLQTSGPAIAAEAVHREERGLVIAASGTFRAAALLTAPLAAAGVVTVAPVSVALAVGGLLIALPARAAHRLLRSTPTGEGGAAGG